MFAIDNSTASATPPTYPTAGTPGHFTDGNPGTGTAATIVDDWWLDQVTQELLNVATSSGAAAAKGNNTQVRDAIIGMASGNSGLLRFVSTTQLAYVPDRGAFHRVNGKGYLIPAAGMLIPNTGVHVSGVAGQTLAISTDYLLFDMDDGTGNLIPDFWPLATGHMMDTTAGNVGQEVRNNGGVPDSTRSLIGMVGTDAAGHFSDTDGARLLLSWFNQDAKTSITTFTAQRSTSSNSPVEVNSEIRAQFLTWGNKEVIAAISGEVWASLSSTSSIVVSVGFDGSTALVPGASVASLTSNNAGAPIGVYSPQKAGALAEGRHTATLLAATTAGAAAEFWGADLVNSGTTQTRPWLEITVRG